ncbi:hypothetical protein NIE88_11895 [Sporolactobacillus shoreicorticis]|uniref:D-alanyl-D-alanine carboxypeptidase n=1 Tax=Sporolactobacillus shoreicorticis TaxID=1923877 RepID=A0ABW5S234_9BACL|nr:hypothetical protein [Sporolactobacillus shoreicorticis]MCO7126469.1 hypothetical protein [Sporolactobacillus shoreicorticis]
MIVKRLFLFFSVVALLLLVFYTNPPTAQAKEKTVINNRQKITMPEIKGDRLKRLLKYAKDIDHPVKQLSSSELTKLKKTSSSLHQYSISSQGRLIKSNIASTPFKSSHDQIKSNLFQTLATDNRVRVNPTTSFPYNAIA